jgi:hypothetical protein
MFDKIRRRLLRTLLLADGEGEGVEACEAVVDEDDVVPPAGRDGGA